jgi:hypothetical protein
MLVCTDKRPAGPQLLDDLMGKCGFSNSGIAGHDDPTNAAFKRARNVGSFG